MDLWGGMFGTDAAGWAYFFGPILTFLAFVLPWIYLMSYLNSKLAADIQARVGFQMAGPGGFFQPISRFLKSVTKSAEPKGEKETYRWRFVFLSLVGWSSLWFLPLGPAGILNEFEGAPLLFVLHFFVSAFCMALVGFDQIDPRATINTFNLGFKIFSLSVPLLLSYLVVVLPTHEHTWQAVVLAQSKMPLGMGLLNGPTAWIGFCVVFVIGLLSWDFLDFRIGLNFTGYSGVFDFSANLLSMYFSMSFGVFITVLYLGGWWLPEPFSGLVEEHLGSGGLKLVQVMVVLGKSALLTLVMAWLRRSWPKLRQDQLVYLAWSRLTPLSILAFAGTILWGWGG